VFSSDPGHNATSLTKAFLHIYLNKIILTIYGAKFHAFRVSVFMGVLLCVCACSLCVLA